MEGLPGIAPPSADSSLVHDLLKSFQASKNSVEKWLAAGNDTADRLASDIVSTRSKALTSAVSCSLKKYEQAIKDQTTYNLEGLRMCQVAWDAVKDEVANAVLDKEMDAFQEAFNKRQLLQLTYITPENAQAKQLWYSGLEEGTTVPKLLEEGVTRNKELKALELDLVKS